MSEAKLYDALVEASLEAKRLVNYYPARFMIMLQERGAVNTATELILGRGITDGLTRLCLAGKPGLSVEAIVVEGPFRHLFEPRVIEAAKRKLDSLGYHYKEYVLEEVVDRKQDKSEEPICGDKDVPGTTQTTVTRFIRDTRLTRAIKEKFEWKCAICGRRIQLPNGQYYAEAHHVQPLGGGHEGRDREDNILVLCPYHHAEFDYGTVWIDPVTHVVVHFDKRDAFNGKETAYRIDHLAPEVLHYHAKLYGFQPSS